MRLIAGALLCTAVTGCSGLARGPAQPGTRSDRLMAAYAELATGRFWVVADFEQLDHHQLFHVVSHSGRATCIPSNAAGVPETGRRCLRVTLADPLDALVVNNDRAASWSLRRDWRDFHLLVAAVHCPKDATDLEVSITAGPKRRASTVQTRIRLERGWNVLRLDLAEAAERIPIDDVREISFTLPDAQAPIDLVFDDLVLADNRQDIFGSPNDPDEGLYVQRLGRRLDIGAAGRFELGFANAQIVHWFDLGSDPHRLSNLAGSGVLGPSPVVVSTPHRGADAAYSSDFAALGQTVVAHQQVIEANPVRVVVVCTQHFTSGDRRPDEHSPFQRWTYTILRTGRVYVHLECTTQSGNWVPAALGLLASTVDHGSQQTLAYPGATAEGHKHPRPLAYALAHPNTAGRPGLLMVMHPTHSVPNMQALPSQTARRLDLLAWTEYIDRPTHAWSCLLSVWPPGNTDPANAERLALDYSQPTPPEVRVGRLITDSPGDSDGDGFNERFGMYVLEPEDDLLRLEIDPAAGRAAQPVFSVRGTAGHQVWVYLNNVILDTVARDPAGNVLFQPPAAIRGHTLVEVILRKQQADPTT